MTDVRPTDLRPADFRCVYLDYLKAKGEVAATRKYRAIYLDCFLSYLAGRSIEDVREATPEVIDGYRRHMIKYPSRLTGKPLMPKTVGERLSVVKRFYAVLLDRGDLLIDPTRRLEKTRHVTSLPRNILTEDEMAALLAHTGPGGRWGLRDRAIMELLYSTVLRLREIVRLNVGDIDLKQSTVWVHKGKGGKDRVVPMGRTARRWVEAYLAGRGKLFFHAARADQPLKKEPNPLESALFISRGRKRLMGGNLTRMIKDRARSAGIEKRATAYAFRHSCATHMLRNGANLRMIQELLGHAALTTTQIYTRVAPVDLKAAHRRFHPRGKMS